MPDLHLEEILSLVHHHPAEHQHNDAEAEEKQGVKKTRGIAEFEPCRLRERDIQVHEHHGKQHRECHLPYELESVQKITR